jgi:hypothetical protein
LNLLSNESNRFLTALKSFQSSFFPFISIEIDSLTKG